MNVKTRQSLCPQCLYYHPPLLRVYVEERDMEGVPRRVTGTTAIAVALVKTAELRMRSKRPLSCAGGEMLRRMLINIHA